jgi:hypothetical protein
LFLQIYHKIISTNLCSSDLQANRSYFIRKLLNQTILLFFLLFKHPNRQRILHFFYLFVHKLPPLNQSTVYSSSYRYHVVLNCTMQHFIRYCRFFIPFLQNLLSIMLERLNLLLLNSNKFNVIQFKFTNFVKQMTILCSYVRFHIFFINFYHRIYETKSNM